MFVCFLHLFVFVFHGCSWAYHILINLLEQPQIYTSLVLERYRNITPIFLYFLFLFFCGIVIQLHLLMLQTQQYILIIITLPPAVTSLAQYSFAPTHLLCVVIGEYITNMLHFYMVMTQHYLYKYYFIQFF